MIKILHITLSLIFALCFTSCTWSADEEDSKSKNPLSEYLSEKQDYTFFTDQATGKWKDQASDHVPQYEIKKSKDKKNLLVNVTVPFKGTASPSHYVECILLTDHNGKEIQKKVFTKGTVAFTAQFKLPADYKAYFYIIAKCNLHDMWRVKAFPSN